MGKIELKMSLKMKVVISFLLASIIPVLIVSWLLYTQASRYLKENLFSYLEGVSEMKRQGLMTQVRNGEYQLETWARSLRLLNPLSQMYDTVGQDKSEVISKLHEGLENILVEGTDFEEVYIIDTAGKILVSTKKDSEGRDVKDMEYFAQGSRETYFQDPFFSPLAGRLSLVAATPIKKQDGALLGILAGRINLDEFYKTISNVTGLGSTGESYIGNKDNGEAVFLTPTRHDPRSALNIKIKFGDAREKALQNAVQGVNGNGVVKDYRGKMVIASWHYIPDIKWGLVTKIDQEEFEKPMEKWKRYLLFLILAVIIIVGIAAYFFAVSLVKPINLLTSVAERISKGELNLKIDIGSKDEIGSLAKSFERMLAAIKIYREDKG